MKSYEIWCEGYVCTGESGRAHYFGTTMANNFQEACDNFFNNDEYHSQYYNSKNLTYWGCRLFDNEFEARVSFG